jgi:uncharacterized protein
MVNGLQVPGVYHRPQPRAAATPFARTDIAGFIGFERRVQDGSTPTTLLGVPPAGHAFRVDVASFQLVLGGRRLQVPATRDLVLSQAEASIPISPGGSITYAVLAAAGASSTLRLFVVPGPASASRFSRAPTDAEIAPHAPGTPWTRIAHVRIRRSAAGDAVYPLVLPTLPPLRCDDWRDFEGSAGPLGDDDGTMLARAVRAFFANGGSRCWVAWTPRPRRDDAEGLDEACAAMVGVQGQSEAEATGLERLLLIEEVSLVDAPDLYARRMDSELMSAPLPPRDVDACFRRCEGVGPRPASAPATGQQVPLEPLFEDSLVLAAQRVMLTRCAPERWRVLLLLTAPLELDPLEGRYRGPTAPRAEAWRKALDGAADEPRVSCAAFYFPWVLAQEAVGAPVLELPPTPFAAGVIARRDRARGPHVAPANETVHGVVALARPVDDATHGRLYEAPLHINLLRPVPGFGIQLLGARTLSADPWLRFLPVRRCLSAIERRVATAFRPLVFEPNTPALWFQLTQAALGVLLPIFEAGALRGETPEQAFYVRCDDANNPPSELEAGRVRCEVGVAIAAPAEFIVFRLGTREGVVEVLE